VNPDGVGISFLEKIESDPIQNSGNGESLPGPGLAVRQHRANAAYNLTFGK
jgi:hypothetical protein